MRKINTSITIDKSIKEQADALEKKYTATFSHVVRLAIKKMYEAEFGNVEPSLANFSPVTETRGL